MRDTSSRTPAQSPADTMTRRRRGTIPARIALALGIIAFGGLEPAAASQFKRINDINVNCSDAVECDFYISNPNVTLYGIGLRRSAATDAPIRLFFGTREPLVAGSELVLSIDGRVLETIAAGDLAYRAAIAEYSIGDAALVEAFIGAIKAGRTLSVSYRTRSGQSLAPFALEGAAEGLAFMDAVQGRTGRNDAIAVIGDRVQLSAEGGAQTPITALDDLPEPMRSQMTGADAPCALGNGETPDLAGSFAVPVSAMTTLYVVRCGDAFAYNTPYAAFSAAGEDTTRLALAEMTAEGPVAETTVWNAGWDEETRTLSGLFKDRGLGDCGRYHRWALSEGEGAMRLALVESRVNDICGGATSAETGQWPQLWPVVTP